MKLLEIYFWNAVFWAFYLPISILLYLITEQGDILGILIIGFGYTIILTIYLANQDDILFDDWEPAIVLDKTTVPKLVKTPEVKTHAKKEEKPRTKPRTSARPSVGLEPWPKIRTDVDLRKLNASDDDILS